MSGTFDSWAILNSSGNNIVQFNTLISADISTEGQAVSAPVEKGSFSSYNKVKAPMTAVVTLGCSGTADKLQSIIDGLNRYQNGTEMLSLVTPEQEYKNLTLESFSYSRKREDGINALYVELHLLEVRNIAAAVFSSARRASHSKRRDVGKVQAQKYDSIASSWRK